MTKINSMKCGSNFKVGNLRLFSNLFLIIFILTAIIKKSFYQDESFFDDVAS